MGRPILRPVFGQRSHRIIIADEVFGGVDVTVIPAPDGPGHDREFRRHEAAHAYATKLAAATGWPIEDRTWGAVA